jgi:hypothetical protein
MCSQAIAVASNITATSIRMVLFVAVAAAVAVIGPA